MSENVNEREIWLNKIEEVKELLGWFMKHDIYLVEKVQNLDKSDREEFYDFIMAFYKQLDLLRVRVLLARKEPPKKS